MSRLQIALLATATLLIGLPASAVSVSFSKLTANSPLDPTSDLSLEVVSNGPSSALFTFTYGNAYQGFITDIYIEDGNGNFSSMALNSGLSSPGVNFDSPANPANPPGANPFTASFSFDPDNPQPGNGIYGGKSGAFHANLAGFFTFADVENSIANDSLRVALHIQGLPPQSGDGTTSDTFLSVPGGGTNDPPLPEPTTTFLGGLALLLLTRRHR